MPLERFIPKSPDPFIRNSQDFEVAKFGHLNTIIEYINTYVAADSLQLAGTGPLTSTARYITDSLGNTSTLAISTGNIGIGTTLPVAKLQVNGVTALSNTDLTGYPLYSVFNIVRNGGTSMAMDRYTGAPHFNFRAAGGTIGSPSTQVGELGKIDFWSYSGTSFNQNVRLIAQAENFVGGLAQTQRLSIGMGDSGSGIDYYYEMVNGNSYFGASAFGTTPTARVQIKGSGSTSATTSLLVQNSNGTEAFKVTDDRSVTISGGTTTISSPKTFINGISTTIAGFGDTGYGMAITNGITFGIDQGANQGYNFGWWYGLSSIGNFGASRNCVYIGMGAGTPNINNITFTSLNISPTFNCDFASRSGNIVRGIHYNPTLTSFINGVRNQLRAFESSVGGVFINTTNVEASAILQADSTTQGFLPPRMTTAQRTAIVSPAAGLIVYDTDTNKSYTYDGTAWQAHW